MDCSQLEAEGGWFELKGWLEFAGVYTGWELDITQGVCTGTVGGSAPGSSVNHKGLCGYINVFTWNEGDCIIDSFPDTGSSSTTTANPGSTETPSVQRTVLFIEQHTVAGQDVFMLGGSEDINCKHFHNFVIISHSSYSCNFNNKSFFQLLLNVNHSDTE